MSHSLGAKRESLMPSNLFQICATLSKRILVLMSGFELLSDQGLRLDGRKASELRRIRCRMGVYGQADGSAYLEQGNTKVVGLKNI